MSESFFIKFQALAMQLYNAQAQVFFCEFEHLFYKIPPVVSSIFSQKPWKMIEKYTGKV